MKSDILRVIDALASDADVEVVKSETPPSVDGAIIVDVDEVLDTMKADGEELDEVFAKYKATVNMSASELERWSDSQCSHLASIDRSPIERNLRLLRKRKVDWTARDVRDANRTISFVSRMRGNERGEPVSDNCPSRRDISLKNWAFDPSKIGKMDDRHVVCFYHRDLDGVTSGAIVKKLHPDAEMISINYGEQFPWDVLKRASEIWMVDFGLQPFTEMEKLADECKKSGIRFVWIDHHEGSLDAATKAGFKAEGLQIEGEGEKPFDAKDRYSGCDLTWKYCFPSEPMPRVVQLAGRFDVWDHNDPMVLPVHYAMETVKISPESETWKDLFALEDDGFGKMIANGKVIMKYLESLHADHMAGFAFEFEFEGLKCIAANVIQPGSMQFKSVSEGYDAALRFVLTPLGTWTCSLYALKDGVNANEVCQKYGGGGHPGAGGFQCDKLPFDLGKIEPVGDERAEAALKAAEAVMIEPIFKAGGEEKRYTLGLVLEPNDGSDGAPLDPDTHGDIYSADEIWRAHYLYMARYQHIGRLHSSIFAKSDVTLVDSFIVPMESNGLDINKPDGTVRHIRPGSWLQGAIWSEKAWEEVKGGVLNTWSIGGKGYRTPIA